MSQLEITNAYLTGQDIAAIYSRRSYATSFVSLFALSIAAAIALYILKSAAGVDVISGYSFFHD